MSNQSKSAQPDIIYTVVDEAPELASGSFLPIIQAFSKAAGVTVGTKDISLAGRLIAYFSDKLPENLRQSDDLAELGEIVKTPDANVIKLPNISASIPQLKACIAELQGQGYPLPEFPENPQTAEEKETRDRYAKALGSAVNPVLREGNSDRRAPLSVKNYAKKHPHSMGKWLPTSKTHVSHMHGDGDFFSNEKSTTLAAATTAKIEFVAADGKVTTLVDKLPLQAGEVVDATFMSKNKLRAFLTEQVADAKNTGIMFSLHLKATMMKVSDPIMFGHAVSVFFKDLFDKHGATLAQVGANPNNGIGDVLDKIKSLPADKQAEIKADYEACLANGPSMYMVDSNRGITNLHVPSDVIVDASMPALIRGGGKGWDANGQEGDCKCVIPDSCYAGVYDVVIKDCVANGALNPATMGSVPNVGLMAQKAEEYGSHPTTFEAPADGTIRMLDGNGNVIHESRVEQGDIWRSSRVKDAPVQDWVKLAVNRARITGAPAVFWLDRNRAHDAQLIQKVERYLKDHDTKGLDIRIMSPVEATKLSMERIRQGLDTISVTGNVLRDYLTDLFPILELGTSAKMLSIVPLMNGGGLFETGAGGSAPKHVQQFQKEGYLRWDSLGEFAALAASFDHLSRVKNNARAGLLSKTLDEATGQLLDNEKSPARKLGQIDNKASHFYIAMYWAQALAAQNEDEALKKHFAPIAQQLTASEDKIVAELLAPHGKPVDTGGYYHPNPAKVAAAQRPSQLLNQVIAQI